MGYGELLETCYEMANNLPADIEEQSIVTGETFGSVNLAKIKMFSNCQRDGEFKLCMNHDIKKKIESNFGPMEEILEQTQLTEYQLFPLVIQLLGGYIYSWRHQPWIDHDLGSAWSGAIWSSIVASSFSSTTTTTKTSELDTIVLFDAKMHLIL